MSKEEEQIFTDLGTVGENIYFIFKNKGKDLLLDYLLKIKWKQIKIYKINQDSYIPKYFSPFLERYDLDLAKFPRASTDFLKYLSDDAIKHLEEDWAEIEPKVSENLSTIHLALKEYFLEKLNYLKINALFDFQTKIIKQLINNLFRNLPPNVKKQYAEKLQKERKEKEAKEKSKPKEKLKPKVFFYELNDKDLLKDYIPIKFKILFDVLNDYSQSGIVVRKIEHIEREAFEDSLNAINTQIEGERDEKRKSQLKKQREIIEKNKDNYYKQKYRIGVEGFRKQIQRVMRQIETNSIKFTKKLVKVVYDYEQTLINEYGQRRGIFG